MSVLLSLGMLKTMDIRELLLDLRPETEHTYVLIFVCDCKWMTMDIAKR